MMPDPAMYVRQPVSVLYGGAHLFRHDTIAKLGSMAEKQFLETVPDCFQLASALGVPEAAECPQSETDRQSLLRLFDQEGEEARRSHASAWFLFTWYERIRRKLHSEAIEDYRIDFEDGYGIRSDKEEDEDAERCGHATAKAMAEGGLSPFFGIRVKPVSDENRKRAFRTLDLYIQGLFEASSGKLPAGWVVTLPKVSSVEHVAVLIEKLEELERTYGLDERSLHIELMVEDPRVLAADDRGTRLISMIREGRGRVRGAHLGLYDFLSSLGIISSMQGFRHPSADHLRSATSIVAAAEGIWTSDGAVNRIPVGPFRNRDLTAEQREQNREAVRNAWQELYGHVLHSLRFGYYQGWDLHPSQLIPRYAAIYAVFLRDRDQTIARLKRFIETSAHARVDGQEFDDIATGLGLLQYFGRGYACGAFHREDISQVGLELEDVMKGNFAGILKRT